MSGSSGSPRGVGRPAPLDEAAQAARSARRLLEVAAQLAESATAAGAQLGRLESEDREQLFAVVSQQMGAIVSAWTELVRDLLPGHTADPADAAGGPAADDRSEHRYDLRESDPHEADSHADDDAEEDDRAEPSPPRREAKLRVIEPSTRDDLTGLLSRHAGLAAIGREMDRCRRSDTRLVLGFLDVVGLGSLNDERGREAGDEMLRSVAAALTAMLRSRDVIVRLGGDKFVFSMAGVSLEVAEKRFQHVALLLGEKALGASVTIGFADLTSGDTVEELIARAQSTSAHARTDRRRA